MVMVTVGTVIATGISTVDTATATAVRSMPTTDTMVTVTRGMDTLITKITTITIMLVTTITTVKSRAWTLVARSLVGLWRRLLLALDALRLHLGLLLSRAAVCIHRSISDRFVHDITAGRRRRPTY